MAGSISTLGVGSGLELQSILEQLREVDQGVIDRKQDNITSLEAQLEEFTSVKNNLLDLKSKALDLSLSSTFIGRTASSSNDKIIEATVLDGATVKSTAVEVVKLAEQSSWLSDGVSDSTDSVSASESSFSYGFGDDNITLTVAAGTSLAQLADQINDDPDNPGVTASIIDTGETSNQYKLLVQADEFGEDNRINLLATPITMAAQTGATETLDSKIKVDGITYQRDSNSINDVISGVTLNIKDVDTATISVGNNDDALKEKITGLVEAYNEVSQELRISTAYDSDSEELGILAGSTLRSMPFDLQNLMSSFISADSSGKIVSLFDLGMEIERDGTITIDDDTLEEAIQTYPDEVQAFFVGDSDNDIKGFADTVNDRLRTATSSSGILEAEKSAAQFRIDDLELHVEEETSRLDKRYEQLTRRFVELDSFMNQMTSTSNYLSSQFDSLKNAWSGGSSSSN